MNTNQTLVTINGVKHTIDPNKGSLAQQAIARFISKRKAGEVVQVRLDKQNHAKLRNALLEYAQSSSYWHNISGTDRAVWVYNTDHFMFSITWDGCLTIASDDAEPIYNSYTIAKQH